MLKLEYSGASLGALIKKGAGFYTHILWKVFPLAFILSLASVVFSLARTILHPHIGWMVLGVIVMFVTLVYLALALVHQMYAPTLTEKMPGILESLFAVRSKFIKYVVVLLLSMSVLALIGAVLIIVFSLLALIPKGLLMVHMLSIFVTIVSGIIIAVFLTLVIPVVLFEDVGIIKSIKCTISFTRKKFWASFLMVLIARLPTVLFTYAVMLAVVFFATGSLAHFHEYIMMRGSLMPSVIIQLIFLIGAPFFAIWSFANILNLYHTLKNYENTGN